MNRTIKEVIFRQPANNSLFPEPFRLKLNLDKIRTGRQLKEKVAKYLNHFPECMLLQHDATGKNIEDHTPLQPLNIKHRHTFSLAFSKRNYKPPIYMERLIIGGLDFTEVEEMKRFLKKKKYWPQQLVPEQIKSQRKQPPQVQRQMNKIPNQLERQTDLKVKYKTQLQLVKGFECTKDQNLIVAILDQFNGDVQAASELLFSQ